MKRWINTLAVIFTVWVSQSYAANLLEVYNQALKSDPVFKQAEATYLATKEDIPIARAALLPNAAFTGSGARVYTNAQKQEGTVTGFNAQGQPIYAPTTQKYYQTQQNYALSITQTLFNYAQWKALSGAKAGVKSASATYNSAAQGLIIRTATAYFQVLQSYDDLRYTIAERKASARLLEQTEERYKVGLIAITDVQQVKAEYDANIATEIAARNTLSDKLEALRAITGVYYNKLNTIRENLPLITPQPNNIESWVETATKQNYTLMAAYYAELQAKENVAQQRAGHFPTLSASGGYTWNKQAENVLVGGDTTTQTTQAGLTLNFPVYQGGLVNAQTRQASQQYANAAAVTEQNYRATVTNTRTSFLGVISYISKIKADKQSVISNQSALEATEAAYLVGTNTIADVLDQQAKLYNAQKIYAADQYQYILDILNLKFAAGTLSGDDLMEINSWLADAVSFADYTVQGNYHNNGMDQPQSLAKTKKTYQAKTAKSAKSTKSANHKPPAKKPIKPVAATYDGDTSSTQTSHPNLSAVNSVKQLNPNAYTIQLIGVTDINKANAFIAKHQLKNQVLIFEAKSNVHPHWYEIILGEYGTARQANDAIRQLPAALQASRPYVRSIKSVQAEVK